MIYTYNCINHGDFDCILPVSEMVDYLPCPVCKADSKKIIVLGHGGIRRNDSEWVKGVSKIFEIDGHKPMETIDDLKGFYHENPNIRPWESHPAFPSSLGDCPRKPDEAERKRKRRKKGIEYLRKNEALTVNHRTSA